MQQSPQKTQISKYSVLSRQNAVPGVKKTPTAKKSHPVLMSFWGHFVAPMPSRITSIFFWFLECSFGSFLEQLGGQRAPKSVPMIVIVDHVGWTGANVKAMLPCGREHHFWGWRGLRETSFARLWQHFSKACAFEFNCAGFYPIWDPTGVPSGAI